MVRLRTSLVSASYGLFMLGLSSCQADAALGPLSGEFLLRVAGCGSGGQTVVPGACPTALVGDSSRIVEGRFTLLPNRRWESTWERIVVTAGIEVDHRTLPTGGTYRILSTTATDTVLDLYPGQVVPAIFTTTAVIRGDSLFHGAFHFVRR